jgi:hypothetical protein
VNWGTIVFGAVLTALALINDQLHWLPPLQFAALAIAVLLVVVAPRPAWGTLVIAGITAYSVRKAELMVGFDHYVHACLDSIGICGGKLYTPGESILGRGVAKFVVELPVVPAVLVVVGLLGWAVRRRSWRTAVAGAVYGVAVEALPHEAPIVLFAAAAAALGPRRDARYLAGIGILALALIGQQGPWTLIVTIVVIAVTLTLAIWALVKKDGVNGAVALVALASASLTPFLSAGVLLAASLVRRRAWFGLAVATAVVGAAWFTAPPTPAKTGMQWLSQDQVPVQSGWLSPEVLILVATAMSIRRTAGRSAGTPSPQPAE